MRRDRKLHWLDRDSVNRNLVGYPDHPDNPIRHEETRKETLKKPQRNLKEALIPAILTNLSTMLIQDRLCH